MSLLTQVEDYIGTFTDTDAVDAWLTAGARLIIDKTPVEKLARISTIKTDNGSGTSIASSRVTSVDKGGYPSPESCCPGLLQSRFAVVLPENRWRTENRSFFDRLFRCWSKKDNGRSHSFQIIRISGCLIPPYSFPLNSMGNNEEG